MTRWFLLVSLLLALVARPALAAGTPQSVFHIERNKNRNQVHYGVRVTPDCKPDGDEPLYNYWLRIEEGPGVTKPVDLFQQAAYGIAAQVVRGDTIDVRLRALPELEIAVRLAERDDGCHADAWTSIAGRSARLRRTYVNAEEGWVLPTVLWIDLFGETPDGEPVEQRVSP